jgi:hypothetical protein
VASRLVVSGRSNIWLVVKPSRADDRDEAMNARESVVAVSSSLTSSKADVREVSKAPVSGLEGVVKAGVGVVGRLVKPSSTSETVLSTDSRVSVVLGMNSGVGAAEESLVPTKLANILEAEL